MNINDLYNKIPAALKDQGFSDIKIEKFTSFGTYNIYTIFDLRSCLRVSCEASTEVASNIILAAVQMLMNDETIMNSIDLPNDDN